MINSLFEDMFHWPLALAIITLFLEVILSRTILLRIP